MGVDVAFWIFAVVSVASALAVVLIKDLFRAALCLIFCFFTVAGIFITLNADLLGGLQVLVYVGAIALLIIFAVMFTQEAQQANRFNKMTIPALIIAVVLGVTMIVSVAHRDDFADVTSEEVSSTYESGIVSEGDSTASDIGQLLFSKDNGYLLVIETAATLLLAAVIGAMVLSRGRGK